MAPATMKAIKCIGVGKVEMQDVPLPKLRDDYALVKITAVALNPTDWKHVAFPPLATEGATVGCDYAGVVEEVGSKVTKSFQKGDRVCGWSHGVNRVQTEDGAFAEYAMVKGDVMIKIPDNLSEEEASTLGIGITTVGQGLYQSLGLPLPGEGTYGKPLLVYGGSTATGTLAIQFAKLSGAQVVTTCSQHNFELVKSLGAERAFDYNSQDCAKEIREYTNDSLEKVFDCISEGASIKICDDAISSKGGMVSDLLPTKHERKDIEAKATLGYTIFGEAFEFADGPRAAKPEDFEFGKKFWELSRQLLAEGKIKVHPVDARSGGLAAVPQGMEDLKQGRVSGRKVVYKI